MSKMESIEEFAICMDITTRMALIALAVSCDKEMISGSLDGIEVYLIDVYPDDKKDLVKSLISQYKDGALMLQKELKPDD